MADFSYEIKEEIAVLSDKNGYSKELNLISYNGRAASYDIRSWHTDEEGHKTMAKGITLNKSELLALRNALEELDLEE